MEAFLEASSFSGSSGRVAGTVLEAVRAFWKVIRRVMRDSKRA